MTVFLHEFELIDGSQGGAAYFCGKGVGNGDQSASIVRKPSHTHPTVPGDQLFSSASTPL